MKAEFVNPFIVESIRILRKMANVKGKTGGIFSRDLPFTGSEVTVFVGVTGDIEGEVLYCMSTETAMKIASAMMMNMPVTEMDSMACSAISELANMITGNASAGLELVGYKCDVTPPTLIRGANISITTVAIKTLAIPVVTDIGNLEINVALKERRR